MAHTLFVGSEKPAAADRIFIDTSALLYLTYPRLSLGIRYQEDRSRLYSTFVAACQRVGAKLFWCGLSLSEIGHRIEQLHCSQKHGRACYAEDVKQLRHDQHERGRVVAEIDVTWQQVEQFGECLTGVVDKPSTARSLSIISSTLVDAYDAFYLDFMHTAGIDKVLTDDSDFSSVPNIIVFSANKRICD